MLVPRGSNSRAVTLNHLCLSTLCHSATQTPSPELLPVGEAPVFCARHPFIKCESYRKGGRKELASTHLVWQDKWRIQKWINEWNKMKWLKGLVITAPFGLTNFFLKFLAYPESWEKPSETWVNLSCPLLIVIHIHEL